MYSVSVELLHNRSMSDTLLMVSIELEASARLGAESKDLEPQRLRNGAQYSASEQTSDFVPVRLSCLGPPWLGFFFDLFDPEISFGLSGSLVSLNSCSPGPPWHEESEHGA